MAVSSSSSSRAQRQYTVGWVPWYCMLYSFSFPSLILKELDSCYIRENIATLALTVEFLLSSLQMLLGNWDIISAQVYITNTWCNRDSSVYYLGASKNQKESLCQAQFWVKSTKKLIKSLLFSTSTMAAFSKSVWPELLAKFYIFRVHGTEYPPLIAFWRTLKW